MKLTARGSSTASAIRALLIGTAVLSCSACHGPRAYLSSDAIPWLHYQRTMCFGPCPAFTLAVASDGSATYTGKAHVDRLGTYTADWSPEQLLEIAATAAELRFDRKAGVYDNPLITDLPATRISLGKYEITDRVNGPDLSALYAALDSLIALTPWTPAPKQ